MFPLLSPFSCDGGCKGPLLICFPPPGKGLTAFVKRNASRAICGGYGENRCYACPESALLSDHAIRTGSTRGDSCLELHHPDAGATESIDYATSQLDLCFDLGALIDDGPGVVDRHGVAARVLSR